MNKKISQKSNLEGIFSQNISEMQKSIILFNIIFIGTVLDAFLICMTLSLEIYALF